MRLTAAFYCMDAENELLPAANAECIMQNYPLRQGEENEISPLRCAPVEMTYEGDGVPVGLPNVSGWVDPSTRPPAALVRMTPGGDGVPIRGTVGTVPIVPYQSLVDLKEKGNDRDSPHRSPLGCVEAVAVEAMVILSLPALTVNGGK